MSDITSTINFKNPIQMPVGSNGANVTFNNLTEVSDFIQSEREAWSWILPRAMSNGHEKSLRVLIKNQLVEVVLSHLDKIYQLLEKAEVIEELNELLTTLNGFNFPFSNTPLGGYIINKSRESEIIAIFILYLQSGGVIKNDQRQGTTFTNVVNIFSLELNTANRLLLHFEAISNNTSLKSNIDFFDEKVGEINNYRNIAADTIKELEGLYIQTKQSNNNWIAKFRTKLAQRHIFYRRKMRHFRAHQTNISHQALNEAIGITKAAKDTFSSQIELDSSVSYWNSKKENHKDSSRNWLIALISFTLLLPLIPLLSFIFLPQVQIDSTHLIFGVLNPISLSLSIIFISSISYAIRFCSKQYSSHQHLFLEATERCTLIKTYLALMNENKLDESDDRKLALECLFRNAQTGIVTDFGNVLPSDAFVKIIEKQVKSPG